MLAFLILPVLVSGFIVCNFNPSFYYKIHRYQGQYLYFISAGLGMINLILSSMVLFLAYEFIPSSIYFSDWEISTNIVTGLESSLSELHHEKSKDNIIVLAEVIIISLGTVLTAFVWSASSHIWLRIRTGSLDASKILIMSKVLSDSPMDKIFFESYLYSQPLLLSLDSRKVYVGVINSLGEINESSGLDKEISLIPIMSGYRDKDTLEVSFTTYYEVIDTDLDIVIRQDQIFTASWFDFDVYKRLNHKKASIKYFLRSILCK